MPTVPTLWTLVGNCICRRAGKKVVRIGIYQECYNVVVKNSIYVGVLRGDTASGEEWHMWEF